MDTIDRLAKIFERFPGIGPRQAGRFVQYLLRNKSVRRELEEVMRELESGVRQCAGCMRFFAGTAGVCGVCGDTRRDDALLAVVASDADLLALERSGTFRGRYFVLGGTVSLGSEKMNGLRVHELIASIRKRASDVREIILAFPANPEGDTTAARIREELAEAALARGLSVTSLGRGLSTGSELEYADPETLKSALASRK